jgi:3-methyladenine DNA glycosylase AlkD
MPPPSGWNSHLMITLVSIQKELKKHENPKKALTQCSFFKNCQDDIFLGISAPLIRNLAKTFSLVPLRLISQLMRSSIHEERSLAHAILRLKFDGGNEKIKTQIFNFYLKHRKTIKDWDGVDDSAPYIVGKYLLSQDKKILYTLAQSDHIWDRRIAIVSTWWFIRNGHYQDTIKLAEILIIDQEDLIHKAIGWMLREVGKREISLLKKFLNKHHTYMPRVTVRYAIERFPEKERKAYLR